MKGLLIKEFGLLKSTVKAQAFSMILFAAIGFLMKNVAYTGMMVTLLVTNMILMTLTHDEACSWNRYAMTLPVRREDLMTVKYILVYILTAVSIAFVVVLGIPLSMIAGLAFSECAATAVACGAVAMFATSLNVMLCAKFEVEKARIFTTLIYLISFGLVFALYFLAVEKKMIDLSHVTEEMVWMGLALAVAMILLLSVLFWRISCHIIKKQDL